MAGEYPAAHRLVLFDLIEAVIAQLGMAFPFAHQRAGEAAVTEQRKNGLVIDRFLAAIVAQKAEEK